ncbi:hydrogenase maturation protease [Hahella sp. HN01]|uniref:hydrogenase maturation protease n=1 Tax=Hahella sp. HN01 TaxID=2847262 RepID=UPI001C1EC26B|nr:hydrogenase maturation protease [Hahella sp. HN01]MBU6950269.1 hydrogenase maturation protease [Hahella sp. HN01]
MMTKDINLSTLVIGYGNPGRQDDGLGPACADRIAELNLAGVTVETNYQLTVEDALELSRYQQVVFIDASLRGGKPFFLQQIEADDECPMSSHVLSPQAVVTLSRTLFSADTEAFLMGIRGYAFDRFEEALSPEAQHNLNQAFDYLASWLQSKEKHPGHA